MNAHGLAHLRKTIAITALCLVSTLASAQSFPGQIPDEDYFKLQEKANSLFEKGQFERALKIYRRELATVGDKYAQYMVGYTYFSGSGVPQNHIVAAAWYRLAAERGDANYAQVRDGLMQHMNDSQRQLSHQEFLKIRAEVGDAALLTALVEEDLDFLRIRVKSDKFNLDSLGRRNHDRNRKAYRDAADRAVHRLDFLHKLLLADRATTEAELSAFDKLDDDIQAEIISLEDFERAAPP